MGIRSLISTLFGSGGEDRGQEPSGQQAMDRITAVLLFDRADMSPGMLENMKSDIIEVIKKYLDIDEQQIDLALKNEDEGVILAANIPIKSVSRRRIRQAK
jgi:cell division topological specificity factor